MVEQLGQYKRSVAYKFRIGAVLGGVPRVESDKLLHVEVGGKLVSRVNIVGNIVDKFVQDGEKKFGSLTLDDATGQIKIKVFGEDIEKFNEFDQGNTIVIIGRLRVWNGEIYLIPEAMKKQNPAYLLVRKLEIEANEPKTPDREKLMELKDKIMSMTKEAESEGGIGIDKIIMDLKENPDVINNEVKKLLEEGLIYEPRPGKIRYLG